MHIHTYTYIGIYIYIYTIYIYIYIERERDISWALPVFGRIPALENNILIGCRIHKFYFIFIYFVLFLFLFFYLFFLFFIFFFGGVESINMQGLSAKNGPVMTFA